MLLPPMEHHCMYTLPRKLLLLSLTNTKYAPLCRGKVWLMLLTSLCYFCVLSLLSTTSCPTGEDIMHTPKKAYSLPACRDQLSPAAVWWGCCKSGPWSLQTMADSKPAGAARPPWHLLLGCWLDNLAIAQQPCWEEMASNSTCVFFSLSDLCHWYSSVKTLTWSHFFSLC